VHAARLAVPSSTLLPPVPLPSFFLIGAAKSATTSMTHYLDQHPGVFMCPFREPTFFGEGPYRLVDAARYVSLFRAAPPGSIIGEASTGYLNDPDAAETIQAFRPEARILAVLRDPVERAHALYLHQRRWGHERATTFRQALALEPGRTRSRRVRENGVVPPDTFFYVGSGRYDEKLRPWLTRFPADRFFIRTYEELRADPATVVDDAFAFLGVAPLGRTGFPIHNENPGLYRHPWMMGRLARLGLPGRAVRYAVKGPLQPKPQLDEDLRLELREIFRPSVARLAGMLGRDRLWWYERGSHGAPSDRR